MLKYLFLVLMLSGCGVSFYEHETVRYVSEPMCKVVFKVTTATANLIATVLRCERPDNIAQDLVDSVSTLSLCSRASVQTNDFICTHVSDLISTLATRTTPESWQCKIAEIDVERKRQIAEACGRKEVE